MHTLAPKSIAIDADLTVTEVIYSGKQTRCINNVGGDTIRTSPFMTSSSRSSTTMQQETAVFIVFRPKDQDQDQPQPTVPQNHFTMNGASAPNGTSSATGGGTGFLSFNSHPPRVYVAAEDSEFDETALQNWRDEGESRPAPFQLTSAGYHVSYCPMGDGGKAFLETLRSIPKSLSIANAVMPIQSSNGRC
jgi:hypothetical protein